MGSSKKSNEVIERNLGTYEKVDGVWVDGEGNEVRTFEEALIDRTARQLRTVKHYLEALRGFAYWEEVPKLGGKQCRPGDFVPHLDLAIALINEALNDNELVQRMILTEGPGGLEIISTSKPFTDSVREPFPLEVIFESREEKKGQPQVDEQQPDK